MTHPFLRAFVFVMEPTFAAVFRLAVNGLVWTRQATVWTGWAIVQAFLRSAAYVYKHYYLEVFWLTTAVVLGIPGFTCDSIRLAGYLLLAVALTPFLYAWCLNIRARSEERKEEEQRRKEKERRLQQEKEEAEELRLWQQREE